MEKFLSGVVLRQIDDTRLVDDQPIRKLFERIVEDCKDGYAEGTVYQSIDQQIPGRPFTRPVRHIETVVVTNEGTSDDVPDSVEVDRMEALRASNIRIESDQLVCDITVSDTMMGSFLLDQEDVRFFMEGEYDVGSMGVIYGNGTNMPGGFKLHHVHAAVAAPVPQVPYYWHQVAYCVKKLDNAVLHIAKEGGIPKDAEMDKIPSGLMDAFSNLMDQRAFFLNNGSIYHGDAAAQAEDDMSDEKLRESLEVSIQDVARNVWVTDRPTPTLESVLATDEEEEFAAPLDGAGVHAMQRDFEKLADEIGGINGAEMFTSGDMVVFGETEHDYWVFWYDNVSGQDNTNRMWRVSKENLVVGGGFGAHPGFEAFISMFTYRMRCNYPSWKGESRSPHPIIVEVHMPLDARHHTKSKVLPVIKRGVFMVDTES